MVAELHDELAFELELIDIGGRPELEARYRELLPAVEIDGELAFTYFVDADALRARLGRSLAVPSAQPEEPLAQS